MRDLVDADRGPRELQAIDEKLHAVLGMTAIGLGRLGLQYQPATAVNEGVPGPTGTALAGVDGCRAGWIAAVQGSPGDVRLQPVEKTQDLLDLHVALVAIDMPIGLRDSGVGGRPVDRAARARLGDRRSSVFSAPPRAAFVIDSWNHPQRASFGLTLQALGILAKVQELDAAIDPDRQWRGRLLPVSAVAEVHPEVSFAALNGGTPASASKRTRMGRALRADLLRHSFPNVDQLVATRPSGVGADDVLDALVALWTARRIVSGEADRMGGEIDERGLEMAIWA